MINWLLEQQWPLSVTLLALIGINRYAIHYVGARLSYLLWALVPIVLVVNNLPNPLTSIVDTEITRYVVNVSNQVNQFDIVGLSLIIWLMGAMFVVTRIVSEHTKLVTSIRHGHSKRVENHSTKFSIFKNESIDSPILVGLINTRLLLPSNFTKMFSEQQQELIYQHESVHFSRKDNWANTFAIALVLVFWFNPLIWIAYASYRKSQEISCDEAVLKNSTKEQKISYCKAMLNTVINNQYGLYSYSHYMEKSTMKKRMQYIQTMPKGNALVKLLIATTLTAALSSVAFAKYGEMGAHKESHSVKPIVRIEPLYPKQAADAGTEGSVVLKFDITSSGKVENVSVVNAKPKGVFDREAKKALRQWQYTASTNGQKDVLVQLDFAMNQDTKLEPLIERVTIKSH